MILKLVILLVCITVVDAARRRTRYRRTYIEGPCRLSHRIAIVGGGASGVHMAYLLKQKGFKNVEILEMRKRAGGKSLTINYRGAPHEMGTCYLAPDYEENIIALSKKFTSDTLFELPNAAVWLDGRPGPITYKQYVGAMSMKNFKTRNGTVALKKLVGNILKYIKLHENMFGNYTGELMPRPNAKVLQIIRGTFLEYLQRHGLTALLPLLLPSHTMQGYGHIDEVAALYGLLWITPKMMKGLLKRIQGQPHHGFYMLTHGFEPLWKAMIKKEKLRIIYGVDVQHVYRTRYGSWLCTKGHKRCEFYKFVIWSPDLKQSLHKFHPTSPDERDIFNRLVPVFFTTSLVDTLGVKRGLSSIDYLFNNALKKRENSLWTQRDSYAAVRGYTGLAYQNATLPSGNDGRKLRTTVAYQYAKKWSTKKNINQILKRELTKMGATYIKIKKTIRWRYFPRFNPNEIKDGILWDIVNMQGRRGMWYIGSSVIFESVKSVVEYNELLIRKMKPPYP